LGILEARNGLDRQLALSYLSYSTYRTDTPKLRIENITTKPLMVFQLSAPPVFGPAFVVDIVADDSGPPEIVLVGRVPPTCVIVDV
jgi:hypothetical protein